MGKKADWGKANEEKIFNLPNFSWVLRFSKKRFGIRPWHWGILSFCIYYVVPLLLAGFGGVLIPPTVAATQFEPLGLEVLGKWLSRAEGVDLYYLTDIVHLIMSITLLVGSTLLLFALERYKVMISYFIKSKQLSASSEVIKNELKQARNLYKNPIIRSLLLFVGLGLAAFMFSQVNNENLTNWWGHISHGYAGVFFTSMVWAMIFYGGSWVLLLALGLRAFARILRFPVKLRPFHPDGCNGFGKFGNYLLLLFFLSLTIAATVWLCLWQGYLGVENLFITWLAGALGLLSIPLILISPLVRCTLQISRARNDRLNKFKKTLGIELENLEEKVLQADESTSFEDDLKRIKDCHSSAKELYPSNVFPFKPKIAGTVSIGYIVQVVLFILEAIDRLNA